MKKLVYLSLHVLMLFMGTTSCNAGEIAVGFTSSACGREVIVLKAKNNGRYLIIRDLVAKWQWTLYYADEDSDPIVVDTRFYYDGLSSCTPRNNGTTGLVSLDVNSSNLLEPIEFDQSEDDYNGNFELKSSLSTEDAW